MRVLNCNKQPYQPFPQQDDDDYRKEEDELTKFDVDYLIQCICIDRNKSLRILDRPDTKNRQAPQPDYLVQDCATNGLITIEYARFFENEELRAKEATLVKKLDGESNGGVAVISRIRFPSSSQLAKQLSDFVSEKLSKGQFKDFGHTERILLLRNRWSGIHIHRFVEAGHLLTLPEPLGCDHLYLIADRRLLEVF